MQNQLVLESKFQNVRHYAVFIKQKMLLVMDQAQEKLLNFAFCLICIHLDYYKIMIKLYVYKVIIFFFSQKSILASIKLCKYLDQSYIFPLKAYKMLLLAKYCIFVLYYQRRVLVKFHIWICEYRLNNWINAINAHFYLFTVSFFKQLLNSFESVCFNLLSLQCLFIKSQF